MKKKHINSILLFSLFIIILCNSVKIMSAAAVLSPKKTLHPEDNYRLFSPTPVKSNDKALEAKCKELKNKLNSAEQENRQSKKSLASNKKFINTLEKDNKILSEELAQKTTKINLLKKKTKQYLRSKKKIEVCEEA